MASQTNGVGSAPGSDDDRKLFVGGLGRSIGEAEIREYFGKFGEVESVNIKLDQYTGQSRGFAFVTFKDAQVINELLSRSTHYIGNRKIDPKKVAQRQMPLNCKIFVGGLTPELTDSVIKEYFSKFGNIVEFQAPLDKKTKQRKGFCFITFSSKEIVYKALKVPRQTINGKEVDVKKVKFNPETMSTNIRAGRMEFPWDSYSAQGYAQPGYGSVYPGMYDGYDAGFYGGYGDYSGYGGYGYDNGAGYGYQGGYGGGGKFRDNTQYRQQPY